MSTRRLKDALRAGRPGVLVNPDHPSSSLVAALETMGVDAVMIDCEQGSASFVDVEEMSRAARAAGMSALVRVPAPAPWVIERYMLRGIDGVVIPRLDTAAEAAAAVEAVRYCAPRTFADTTVIVQIESRAAVAELDGFLALDEVDAYFIGPVDLSKSLGFGGDYRTPEVMAVLDQVIDRVVGAGRAVGTLVTGDDVRHWRERGVTLCYTHVNEFLRMGADEWRRRA
jgi:2-keto-3-deoxy-L-rhamnonate aldolase RhmA